MYVTKKHLSRRAVLRGAGFAVSLPLLDAMIPAGTALAQTAAAPKPTMGFVYFPHGAVMDRWTPAALGRNFELPQILAPLERHRDYMTIVSGLDNAPTQAPPTHAVVPGTWLSCVPPWLKTAKKGAPSGRSLQCALPPEASQTVAGAWNW